LQNMSRIKKWGCALLLFGFVVFAPQVLQAQEKTQPAANAKTRLAVIPFQSVMPDDAS